MTILILADWKLEQTHAIHQKKLKKMVAENFKWTTQWGDQTEHMQIMWCEEEAHAQGTHKLKARMRSV